MSPPSGSTAGEIHHPGLDPKIWQACADPSIQIPLLGSRVYYFPQGHIEHCIPSSPLMSTSRVLCVIAAFHLLADPITDEVFVHLFLQPVLQEEKQFIPTNTPRFEGHVDDNNDGLTTFVKNLSLSDANNGGGFSVPRHLAFSIFPKLDYQKEPPLQNLSITDTQGAVWEFRHIYRGTPRRHLLTTGWNKFVNDKQLIAGDSVVFMKNTADEMFIGVRRARISRNGEGTNYNGGGDDESNGGEVAEEDDGSARKQFRRTGNGRLTAEAVSEAMNKAAEGKPFEVVYYPTAGWSEFVVKAEDVDSSMSMPWTPGTRVKMAIPIDNSSRIPWFEGTVSCIHRGSPWKPLQITWDESESLQNVKRVNPWQVTIVAHPGQMLKYPLNGRLLSGDNGQNLYFERGQSSAVAPDPTPYSFPYIPFPAGLQRARHHEFGSYNPGQSRAAAPDPSLFPYTTFPAGMHGARHSEFGSYNPRQSSAAAPDPSPFSYTRLPAGMHGARHSGFGSYNPTRPSGGNPPRLCTNYNSSTPLPGLGKEMNFGSLSSDDLSLNINSTNMSSGNDMVGNRVPMSAKGKSIVLFGNTITMHEPSGSGLTESGSSEEDDSKESSDNETQLSLWTHGPQKPAGV